MKYLLLILLLPFYSSPSITYRTLTWKDFKGAPTNDHAASSCTGIVIEKDTAYAIFEPDRSWTRTSDLVILRHEQLHFAITKECAEKICLNLHYPDSNGRSKLIEFNLLMWQIMEERYDTETNHTTLMADGLAALFRGEQPANIVNPEVLTK